MKTIFKLLVLAFITASLITFSGCKKDTEIPINGIPILKTSDISMITLDAVVVGGNITSDGGSVITSRGVCWSIDQRPTILDAKTNDGAGSGSFTSNLTDLNPHTTYFFRAYAITSTNVTYGNEISFATLEPGDFIGRRNSNAASFSIGKKVYTGSSDGESSVYDFWEFDHTTNTWTRKANFPGKQTDSPIGFSIGKKGYIGFGSDPWQYSTATYELWEYDPLSNSWTQIKSLAPSLPSLFEVSFSIGTKVYVGFGSYGGLLPGKDFWEWDQENDVWTKKADFGGIARRRAVGFSIGNKGYIGTGSGGENTLYKDFWEWDQATDVWTKKADFGGIARNGAVSFSIGNKGYIGAGIVDDKRLKDFWEWDQATDVWTKKADFGGTALSGAVGFSIGNKGYISKGYENGNIDLWEWDQATNVWTK